MTQGNAETVKVGKTPREKLNELGNETRNVLWRLQMAITHHLEGVTSIEEFAVELQVAALMVALFARVNRECEAWEETGEQFEQ